MEDECIPCPDNPWLIPLMIFLALIFGMIAYRKLKKMRLNFMIISMLFDHMQILSLLAGAKISWPWQIKIPWVSQLRLVVRCLALFGMAWLTLAWIA